MFRTLIALLVLTSFSFAADQKKESAPSPTQVIPPTLPDPNAPIIIPLNHGASTPSFAGSAPAAGGEQIGIGRYSWYGLNPKGTYTGVVTWRIEPVIELVGGKRTLVPGEAGLKEMEKPVTVFGKTASSEEEVFSEVPAGAAVVWGKASGKVALVAYGIVKDKPQQVGSFLLTIGGGSSVDPEKDKKEVKPVKTTARLQVVNVEETQQASASRVKFFGDEAILAYLAEKKWPAPVVVDQNGKGGKDDKPPANIKAYIDRATSGGRKLPQMFIVVDEGQPDEGKVLFEGNRPATPAAVLELLKSYGG